MLYDLLFEVVVVVEVVVDVLMWFCLGVCVFMVGEVVLDMVFLGGLVGEVVCVGGGWEVVFDFERLIVE